MSNPYQVPENASSEYFAEEITRMPFSVIWRICRHSGVIGAVAFIPLAVRKLLKLSFPPFYGVRRHDRLFPIQRDELRPEEAQSIAELEHACEQAGYAHAMIIRPDMIGHKRIIASIWVDSDKLTFVNIVRVHVKTGNLDRTEVSLNCNSLTVENREVLTSEMQSKDQHVELIPPYKDCVFLESQTPPQQIIEQHRQRLSGRMDLIRLEQETLVSALIGQQQRFLDFVVKQGFYIPLKANDLERLGC